MNAITLRKIPPNLQKVIQERANSEGLSLNKTVLRMLEESAGLRRNVERVLHHDLDQLAGTWSAEEARAFDRALEEQRKIDPELWD